ncbi:MAG: LD-carboxypeptidase, partial [Moraxellaceae bacterium]
DEADFSGLEKHPKWLVGFSDITALHCHANKLGFETIHAAMPFQFGKEGMDDALQSLKNVLFEEEIQYEITPHSFNKTGTAKGKVIGGNLSILSHIIGTKSDLDTTGCILFLEDLDEYLYHIDRLMVHLKRCGKLDNLVGLIVGHMSDMKDNTVPFGKEAYEIIQHHTEKFNYPVCFDFPVGHEVQNIALICGREATLAVGEENVTLTY